MLDRDEKEIELCMQFYINEKMVEIIDDIFCLTNFIQYQNQDGPERIREQKRLRQARWRERKSQGLIGCVDEKASTSASTPRLPSNSISNSISNIFNYWNNKRIIMHRELTEDISKAIEKALKTYKEDEIKTYIDRYATVIGDKEYFWHYKWSLKDFLSRKEGVSAFTDEGRKWARYCGFIKTEKAKSNNNTQTPKFSEFSAEDALARAIGRSYDND